MSNKTSGTAAKTEREQAVEAALTLAAERGWLAVSMHDVSEKTGLSLDRLHDLFVDRYDILAAYGRIIDRRVLAAIGTAEDDTSIRDRLFDLMMERFDVLNEQRAGVCALLDSFRPDPKQALLSLPHLGRSMAWMLDAAGVDTGGLRGIAKVLGLTMVYLNTLRTWREDESEDLAKTMAALDSNLGRAETWANRIG